MNPAELYKRAPAACRASTGEAATLALRIGGASVTDARRDELLAKCNAGEHVEIEVDLLAFEQQPGIANRNYVRFRDGGLRALGRSGKGTPLLRDHLQDDLGARAGTIVDSKTIEIAEGHYQIRQTARVTAPWAADALLRGNLDRFSIGWNPTGPVVCSACDRPILTVCSHFPGDRLAVGEDGKKTRSADGDLAVEWIFTSADLVETSGVSVPAVPSAQIEGIRAALSAHGFGNSGEVPEEILPMKRFSVLVTMLGLGATATEDEVLAAVEKLTAAGEAQAARLALVESQRDRLAADLEAYKVKERQVEEDALVRHALDTGRIRQNEDGMLRRVFRADPEGARAELAKIAPGSATPIGQPMQSSAPAAPERKTDSAVSASLMNRGIDPAQAAAWATAWGAKDVEGSLAQAVGLKREG